MVNEDWFNLAFIPLLYIGKSGCDRNTTRNSSLDTDL